MIIDCNAMALITTFQKKWVQIQASLHTDIDILRTEYTSFR